MFREDQEKQKRKGKEVYVNRNPPRGAEKERLYSGETVCKPRNTASSRN